jgi:glycosyltransferase involved in cell wall biosynthesis
VLNRIAVLVPAHNEQTLIPACLAAAGAVPVVAVELIVAGDACTDDTARIAARAGAHVVRVNARNVGAARAAAAAVALRHGPHGLWLATTDADSRVSVRWLHQHRARRGAQVIAGSVTVDDWRP